MKRVAGKLYFIYAARYVVYLFLRMQMRILGIVFMDELLLHHVDTHLPSGVIGRIKFLFQLIKENWLSVTFKVKVIGHRII